MAPIVVVAGPDDLTFHRTAVEAIAFYGREPVAVASTPAFDAAGRRLLLVTGEDETVRLVDTGEFAPAELAQRLRDWLGHMDALREATTNWSLELLLRASVDHLGYTE